MGISVPDSVRPNSNTLGKDGTTYHVLRVGVDGDEDPRRGGEQHRHHEQAPSNPKENISDGIGEVLALFSDTYTKVV